MKTRSTRKNQFKKKRAARRARIRERVRFAGKVMVGVLVLVTVSVGFIFTHDIFTQAQLFQARRIVVAGQQRLSRQRVLEIAGIGKHTNILAVNLTTTRKRLLADPWISEATIHREIPSGLGIRIREERPLALLEMVAGQGYLINAAGRVFKRENSSGDAPFPRIQGLGHRDLPVAGLPATKNLRAVMKLFRLAAEKNSPMPLSAIDRIHMDREIGATVHTREGDNTVKLGFGFYREKIEALGQLMAQRDKDSRLTRYRTIDLFDVNRIVITPAAAGPSGSDDEEV